MHNLGEIGVQNGNPKGVTYLRKDRGVGATQSACRSPAQPNGFIVYVLRQKRFQPPLGGPALQTAQGAHRLAVGRPSVKFTQELCERWLRDAF